jgi:hypothetical protein
MSFPLGSAKKDDKQKAEESYDMTTKKNVFEMKKKSEGELGRNLDETLRQKKSVPEVAKRRTRISHAHI